MFVVVRTESGPTPRNRTVPRVTNHAGRETAADGPRRSVAGAHRCTSSAASPPSDAASVTVREDRGGDATSEKAAGESESDVRARVGGEEQEPRGDGDGSKGDDAATRGPPRRPRTPSRGRQRGRSAGRRCRAGGGGGRRRARRRRLPVALRRRLPRRWPWRWPHWQRLHLPPPQLPLLPWSKENGNRKEKNAMRTRIQKRELTTNTYPPLPWPPARYVTGRTSRLPLLQRLRLPSQQLQRLAWPRKTETEKETN